MNVTELVSVLLSSLDVVVHVSVAEGIVRAPSAFLPHRSIDLQVLQTVGLPQFPAGRPDHVISPLHSDRATTVIVHAEVEAVW